MSTPPPPTMPISDPEERVYRSAVTFTMLPGQIHEAHMHTDMTQAWIILEGRGEAILGDARRAIVGPGTLIVHHPTQLHGIINIGDTNLVYINVSERPPMAK